MSDTFLYTIELEECYWYVGTTKTPSRRLQEHRDGCGAEWTRIHKPIRFSKKYPIRRLKSNEHSDHDTRLQEDAQVKKVMLEQGINLVRGGSYSQRVLRREDTKALCKELFHANNGCLRCGRESHWAKDCYAIKDVCGNLIEAHMLPYSQKRKRRSLGRRRHYTFKKEDSQIAYCNKQESSSETEGCSSDEETEEVTEEEEDTDEETFSSENDGFSSDDDM